MAFAAPFEAHALAPEVRRFLYACGFWMAWADGEFKPQEQAWLERQFGPEEARSLYTEFYQLGDEAFFRVLDAETAGLTQSQKDRIFPVLKLWLLSLAHADSVFAVRERLVARQILNRLGIAHRPTVRVTAENGRKTITVSRAKASQVSAEGGPFARFRERASTARRPPSFAALCIVLAIGLVGWWMLYVGADWIIPPEGAPLIFLVFWRPPLPPQVTFFGLAVVIAGLVIYWKHYVKVARAALRFDLALLVGYGVLYLVCASAPFFLGLAASGSTYVHFVINSMGLLWVLLLVAAPLMHLGVRRQFALLAAGKAGAGGGEVVTGAACGVSNAWKRCRKNFQ